MSETATSTDKMAEIRVLPGYSELLRVCRAYLLRPTKRGETYFLNRVDNFMLWTETIVPEADLMWTLGWDSGES